MNKSSNRVQKVPPSPFRKLMPYAVEAKKQGVKVYHLNIGDPDIPTPKVMLKAIQDWRRDPISYSQSQGEPEFIEALKDYYHKIGFTFIKPENIQVTIGGSEAISMALFAACEPGDEVIVFEPFYGNYNSYAAVNDVKLVPVLTSIKSGFHLPKRAEIEAKITPKTRALLFCNPNNPTGTVYTREEMAMLIAIAKKHHLFVLSDEVYREFVFDGRKQVSLFEFMQEIPDQAIILDSLSKRYSLCGARLGCLVSLNREIMSGVLRMAMGRLSAGLVDQVIATKLTEVPQKYFKDVHSEYDKRRNVLYQGLKKIPGLVIPKPEGAFYIIVKLPVKDSEDFCKWLLTDFRLNNETIMLAPATGFYATPGRGRDEVRIAYVINIPSLKKSIKILTAALEKYNS